MTLGEVLVVAFGLLAGYWAISKTLDAWTSRTGGGSSEEQVPRQDRPQRSDGDAVAWHEVLNVSAEATIEQIRHAYRALMSQYHPDKVESLGADLKALAERKSKQITSAYREAMRSRGERA